MGKRDRREGGKAEYPSTKANDLPENLSIASDSELDSDQEQDSDLPEETDSEAGLPSEESDSEAFDDNKEEDNSDKDELDQAILDVVETHAASDAQQDQTLPNRWKGNSELQIADDETCYEDEASDSSEDERVPRNTVGEVPLKWYGEEGHIGYDREANKLAKKDKSQLEAGLKDKDRWRTIYDEYNDEQITLSKEEIEMITRIRQGRFPHVEVNPFEPEADWFTREEEIHPLSSAPEPKRRFMPSKWEEKKIVKLVRALRKGWIKRDRDLPKEPEAYLLWGEGGNAMESTATGLTYIPATKPRLPGHEESYNPPQEYLPTEVGRWQPLLHQEALEAVHTIADNMVKLSPKDYYPLLYRAEKLANDGLDESDKPDIVPQAFDALRKVPAYDRYIKERFERCLDLYLCPRARRKRQFVKDPESLVPKLPKPQDLQPFPTSLLIKFEGHKAAVRSLAPHASGQWLASGSDDGTVRLWEVLTGRSMKTWTFPTKVRCVSWCPNPRFNILAIVTGNSVILLSTGFGTEEMEDATAEALKVVDGKETPEKPLCRWQACKGWDGLELQHQHAVHHLSWHGRGDYFTSVAPAGSNQAVLVHQLSKKASQNPFRKNKGRVIRAAFHPTKPFFFVATQNSVRIYNLAKQELSKKLLSGSSVITSLAVHPSGDHVIVGTENDRLAWYDLDLSNRPYRSLRYHQHALRAVAFHRSYPLFASASDDATVHVFHGMVYQDLLTNPLIVPVKVLREHKRSDYEGVLDCAFHPTQPWIFSAGADKTISLFIN